MLALPATGALLAPSVLAEDQRSVKARYAVQQRGLTVAEAALTLSTEGPILSTELLMETQGIVALASGAWSRISGRSRVEGDRIMPLDFDAYYFKRDRVREVTIGYAPGGGIARLSVVSNGKEKGSDVPASMRTGTVDPLTAFHRLRAWFPTAVGGTGAATASQAVFDGRKRYDIEVAYDGPAAWAEGNRERPAHAVLVRLIALHGFDPDDRFMTFPGEEDGERLRVLVPADGREIPALVESQAGRNARIELVAACADARCQAG
jgi:hypothetical protein